MTVHSPFKIAVMGDDLSGLGTGPIPAGPYYKPEYFELEREAIFRRTWLHIGHICELKEPGSFIVRELEVVKASILITRGKDDVIRAFHNVCTHRGTLLVDEAEGKRSSFTCRYHAWNFGLDGELRAAPDFERFYVDQAQCALKSVAVEVCGGMIFVNMDRAPKQSLREFLGPMAEKLEAMPIARATTFSEYVYDIDANWKLTYDNFQEHYHLRFIHPNTSAASCAPENPLAYPAGQTFFGPHRIQTVWSNPNAATQTAGTRLLAFGRGAEFAMADGLLPTDSGRDFNCLFPNLFVFGFPLTHFTQTLYPVSADRTRGVFRLYWIGEDENASERFAREFAMVSTRDVHCEDRDVINAGQQGVGSGALEHLNFQSAELLLRHFFHEVDSRVQAYKAGLEGAAC